ncbi:MAG: response regulator transcription factor, partial [Clostridiales bacterium]|nr:response regulator transcription factor [Clostridiales bacterium]
LCLLDKELGLTAGNTAGFEMLRRPTVFGSSVLYHIKELCEDMLSEAIDNRRLQSGSVVLKTDGGKLHADLLYHPGGRDRKNGAFFITMEPVDGEQAVADYKFKFTKREADIIDGIVQGKNNAQLAEALQLSENTIKTHIQNIYRKAGAGNRTELAYILMMNKQDVNK